MTGIARTVTFDNEQKYIRRIFGPREAVWMPEVNAAFRTPSGRVHRGRAILDSGSPWCAMPEAMAAHLGIDVASCDIQRTKGTTGVGDVRYTRLVVRALGVEADCKVLLLSTDLYLVGRIPFFSKVDVAFSEEVDGGNSRILYREK